MGLIAVLVLLGLLLIITTNITSTVLSGARAFVDGESILSKAQKEASLSLVYYLREEDPRYYDDFKKSAEVIEVYKFSREEIGKDDPNMMLLEQVNRGVERGRSNPEDIRNTVWMYQNLSWTPSMQRADSIWMEAEGLMTELTNVGREIHQQIQEGSLSPQEKERFYDQVYRLDNQLTLVEDDFSENITLSTIFLNNLVYWLTLGIGLLLLIAGGFVSIRFMRNVKRWGASIAKSEEKFRNVLDHTEDVVYQLNRKKGEYVYMSPSIEAMLGYASDKIVRNGPQFIYSRIHPDDLERLNRELNEAQNKRSMENYNHETEFRVKTKKGDYIWVNNRRSVVVDEKGEAVSIVGTVRDISDRKEYERKIDQSLSEKKILLQEIHHRVKNNLAVISGLLYLQKEEVKGEAKTALAKAQKRIESVAMIHEKLYGSDSLSDIDLAEYIEELTDSLADAYKSDEQNITLEEDLDPVKIELVDAVTFGLITNELISNAYKHAFDGREEGTITIILREEGDQRKLTVADTGKGLPGGFDFKNSSSLGMTLIHSLSNQLGAQVEAESSSKGTVISIVF